MAFTEHYCNASTGSNMNGGSDEGSVKYAATNGGWNSGTGVFTPASGNPSSVSPTLVGQMASVFNDGATAPVFIGRVTAVNATTVTVSTTAKSGTAPTTNATGRSINVGGAWKGSNAAVAFPFAFITAAQTNASGDFPRVNFKNNANYAITAAITHTVTGPVTFQGYASTVGDGGKAIIDGGTSGASYILLTLTQNNDLVDLIFQNNGATGQESGVALGAGERRVIRCVMHDLRGTGMDSSAGITIAIECEAYNCNQANTANFGGFAASTASQLYIRCISHNNSGSNSVGFFCSSAATYVGCIADTNGAYGLSTTVSTAITMTGCDFYANVSDGVRLDNPSAAHIYIENCNFVKNGGYGINGNSAQIRNGAIINCGFGAGTQVNTSGTTTGLSAIIESGSITYASNVTPWVDPANGDFRINLGTAKGTGRGAFTQTAASYAGTVGYPDVGAGQHQETATSGGFIIGG